jgi:hypothetical protein
MTLLCGKKKKLPEMVCFTSDKDLSFPVIGGGRGQVA